jgi:hypothetical protein
MAEKPKKQIDPQIAQEIADRNYNKSVNNTYGWAADVINELRIRGFTEVQQKNILYHIMAESGGDFRRVQGDYKPNYQGDNGDDWETGRGLVQATGYTYQEVGRRLGIPLGKNPKLATHPEYAAKIAAEFYKWKQEENPNLNFDNPEDVHKATGPKETYEQRINRLSKGNPQKGIDPVRFPTSEDISINTPAYDPKAYSPKENGTLEPVQENISDKIIKMADIGKDGIKLNTSPSSR